ncbi:MAG: hypothetical protein BWZ10_03027 [candidate division BRC1 bacterium ADurb.BinA364]|nr:MAG: hypothetical protein BWZ10_03027 [candidate division BRC1 bacterium ADurb.BinA364]
MKHGVRAAHQGPHALGVAHVSDLQPRALGGNIGQILAFAVRQVVHGDDLDAARGQLAHDFVADEARSAGHDRARKRVLHGFVNHGCILHGEAPSRAGRKPEAKKEWRRKGNGCGAA